jgi:hypothetical protein
VRADDSEDAYAQRRRYDLHYTPSTRDDEHAAASHHPCRSPDARCNPRPRFRRQRSSRSSHLPSSVHVAPTTPSSAAPPTTSPPAASSCSFSRCGIPV